ncbi:MAG TPA: ribosome maturation factor RimP [Longimicrobiaceae bacterium]|nr:ribosome maturation factor RimP [Longimicrobiaceae bacterium]
MAEIPLESDVESRVEAMGFEMVELERAGDRRRPILRISIDRPDSVPGQPGVSVDDCAVVSRGLQAWLDALEGLPDTYVLEVSSPGVERPLVRRRDWERFAGQPVALRGKGVLAGRAKRLQGTLAGLRQAEGGDAAAITLEDGAEVEIPLAQIDRANLVYRWEKPARP